VNFTNAKFDKFMNEHWDTLELRFHGNRRVANGFLKMLGAILREAWDKQKWETAEQNLEHVFAAEIDPKLGEVQIGPVVMLSEFKFRRPAFQVRLGKKLPRSKQPAPTFEPRDVLDEIAYAILRASSLGWLKMCAGHLKGWHCPTPYLVAHEGRTRFCYEHCGDVAKADAKRKSEQRIKAQKGKKTR